MRRFFIPIDQINRPDPHLRGDEARHILQVLRMRVGDRLVLFDNTGQEYQAGIRSISGEMVYFELLNQRTIVRESPLRISLGLPLIRPQPFEWIIQKGTELGVASFHPFYSVHSRQNFEKTEMASRMKRWQKIVIEAAKQCGRNLLPEFSLPVSFSDLLSEGQAALKLIPYEEESSKNLKDLEWPPSVPGSILGLVGPEGGFHQEEIKQAEAKGFIPISLGPRILRSETAALSLVSLLQFLWGDMGSKPSCPPDAGTGER